MRFWREESKMRRVMPLKIRFVNIDALDSEDRLKRAYGRIFVLVKQNLQNRRFKRRVGLHELINLPAILGLSYVKLNSTQEYTT